MVKINLRTIALILSYKELKSVMGGTAAPSECDNCLSLLDRTCSFMEKKGLCYPGVDPAVGECRCVIEDWP